MGTGAPAPTVAPPPPNVLYFTEKESRRTTLRTHHSGTTPATGFSYISGDQLYMSNCNTFRSAPRRHHHYARPIHATP